MIGFNAAIVVKIANDAAKIAVIGNEKILQQKHLEVSLNENMLYQK